MSEFPLVFRGQMLTLRQGPADPEVISRAIGEMARAGLNLLVIEVERGLRYESHPGVSAPWALEKKTLGALVSQARAQGMECVPLLPSLSHSGYIVSAFPEAAEDGTPGVICPRRKISRRVVDDLSRELIDLFEPRLFHVGHDELITSFRVEERRPVLQCALCRGDDAAAWFLEDLCARREFLRAEGITMMMWSDMLVDPAIFPRGCFRRDGLYGGAPDHFERALEGLPRDVILCDWQYEPGREYPALRHLQEKGFRVLGCPNFHDNSFLFTRFARKTRTPFLLGMLGTCWEAPDGEAGESILRRIRDNGFFFSGGENAELETKAAAAEARSFGAGDFEHVLDFSRKGGGLLETDGWSVFRPYEPLTPAGDDCLSLRAGRRGKIRVPFIARPGLAFSRFETLIDYRAAGPGRIGVAAGESGRMVFRDLAPALDWSDLVSGHERLLFQLEMTNPGTGGDGSGCLRGFTGRGRVERRKAPGG